MAEQISFPDVADDADDLEDDDLSADGEGTILQPSSEQQHPSFHLLVLPEVSPVEAGVRLDKWVTQAARGVTPEDLSRSRVQALAAAGGLWRDGQPVRDLAQKVRAGQVYHLHVPLAVSAEPEPQDIPLVVVYEDDHLIVIDKPAGMVVHPAAGNADGTLVNALLHHCAGSLSGIGGVCRPGIVHRIDKDTSGLLVVAKSDRAHHGLAAQFAAHSLERAYQAVVWGVPSPRQGQVTGNIGRNPHHRQKMAVVARGGKTALTRYQVQQVLASGQVSLIECRLATGRTHQIRVHMTHLGHSLLGDPLYGAARRLRGLDEEDEAVCRAFVRQALHAAVLGFVHPVTGETLSFRSDLPADMRQLLEALS